ncbi:MAG: hypothetical protein AAFZ07_23720, partial [Actinomycetota bacterium]
MVAVIVALVVLATSGLTAQTAGADDGQEPAGLSDIRQYDLPENRQVVGGFRDHVVLVHTDVTDPDCPVFEPCPVAVALELMDSNGAVTEIADLTADEFIRWEAPGFSPPFDATFTSNDGSEALVLMGAESDREPPPGIPFVPIDYTAFLVDANGIRERSTSGFTTNPLPWVPGSEVAAGPIAPRTFTVDGEEVTAFRDADGWAFTTTDAMYRYRSFGNYDKIFDRFTPAAANEVALWNTQWRIDRPSEDESHLVVATRNGEEVVITSDEVPTERDGASYFRPPSISVVAATDTHALVAAYGTQKLPGSDGFILLLEHFTLSRAGNDVEFVPALPSSSSAFTLDCRSDPRGTYLYCPGVGRFSSADGWSEDHPVGQMLGRFETLGDGRIIGNSAEEFVLYSPADDSSQLIADNSIVGRVPLVVLAAATFPDITLVTEGRVMFATVGTGGGSPAPSEPPQTEPPSPAPPDAPSAPSSAAGYWMVDAGG